MVSKTLYTAKLIHKLSGVMNKSVLKIQANFVISYAEDHSISCYLDELTYFEILYNEELFSLNQIMKFLYSIVFWTFRVIAC